MTQRFMLIDSKGDVVAEVKSPPVIENLSGISIINWRHKNYIFSSRHTNGEYYFYQEAGGRAVITDAALEIR